ncbi:protein GRAVITROPIC IN THE LIGHT 1-like [Triticum dicoccoides]|uniref:protein GRAVITROPIC IN THE LIGHT 1-like n=1 Tax=Triticum dicoccoides TaxID=85692 RepID=UPI000E7B24ED|nr:protein GRAVITROPIC IN THE LIGHT 1-like [Triticum dicoccoides]
METLMAAELPQQKAGGLARRLARLLRRKRSPAGSGVAYSVASDVYDESLDSSINSLSQLKLSGNMAAAYSLDALFKTATKKKGAPRQSPVPAADAHAFVANLFVEVSAVKASYARLQLAQHPYDAEAIQSADAALVVELGKLLDHRRQYVRDPVGAAKNAEAGPAAIANEQRHLIRTYEITARKLETELRARDAEAQRARDELADELRATRALEERVHPGRTLVTLDDLHFSGLNATHFLTALRLSVKSVRSFARSMLDEMRLAGWDPAAAAGAVHPSVPLRHAGDAKFALESYITLKMFTNFHRRDFGLNHLQERGSYDQRRFFEEFAELKTVPASTLLDAGSSRWSTLGKFLRDRYISVVHERMEMAFFGRPVQRALLNAGAAFPETAWFAEFAEMARRVWLLHCLFFAFDGGDDGASIFQARAGDRFSEVYMESVSDMDEEDGAGMSLALAGNRVVGFTVVPGFIVGRSVMQSRVYLSRPARHT